MVLEDVYLDKVIPFWSLATSKYILFQLEVGLTTTVEIPQVIVLGGGGITV